MLRREAVRMRFAATGVPAGHPGVAVGSLPSHYSFRRRACTRILGSNQDRDMKVTPAEVLGRQRAAF